MASPVTHYPIPKMVSHNLSDHGNSYPGYRAISQYIHPPWCLQIVCPEPKLKIPDTGLIGGKLLIRAMISTPGLTNPLLKSVKIPQTCNTHKLAVIHKQQTYYNMYQLDNLPIIVTE